VIPEEIELLSELTVVIPTYNRPLELERSIEYWRDTPVTVHIVDGSDKPWYPAGQLPGAPNISYHYFEPNESEVLSANYKNRIRFAAQLPKTRFSALIGEDDFFVISGLYASLKVLSENETICSVTGVSVGYENQNQKTNWGLRQVERQDSKSFESTRVTERLKPQQSGQTPIVFYGIFKTEIWRKVFAISFRHDFKSNLIGGERLVHANALALGPSKEINHVIWIRQFYVERVNLEDLHIHTRGAYDRYLRDSGNKSEIRAYYGLLAEAIREGSSGWGKKKSMRLAIKVLKPGFKTSEQGFKYRLRKKLARTLVSLGTNVSPRLRLSLNRLMGNKITKSLGFVEIDQKLKPALGRQDLNSFLQKLADTEVDYNESEIRKIDELLLKPREELRLRADI
jgi:glycosyltransferase domain-containing protein